MFKFIKDMVAAVNEGAAEGPEEANAELAAQAAVTAKSASEQTANIERQLAMTSQPERLLAALAAPYRETFLSELDSAQVEKRLPLYILSTALPAKEVDSWKSLLERDFDIDDAGSAQALIEVLVREATLDADQNNVAASLVRAAHIANGAVGVGYENVGQALEWAGPLAGLAAARFESWPALGQAFLTGEAKADGSNFMGRKFLKGAVKRLATNPASP